MYANIILQAIDPSFLKRLRILFWTFQKLAAGQGFDRASFQTYLKMLNAELQALSQQGSQVALDLKTSLSKELTVFGSAVQLKTGLGMERIWKHFKPNTPKTSEQLASILNLEALADRLDAAMWKLSLKTDEMIQIRERFASSLQLVKSEDVDANELVIVS